MVIQGGVKIHKKSDRDIAGQYSVLERMVYITEDMVRRRAEHNNCEILSLEEVSLHQQDIEGIEHIERWCRDLKILYLQNNLIPKIENVGRLKKLEYINLSMNNIEVIENLEGCESLRKLDLTLNFTGQLSSVESLKHNIHLRELFLVGNPCSDFEGYRQYIVAALPQLKWLDGSEISRSERIRASWGLEEVRRCIQRQEQEYLKKRTREKEEAQRRNRSSERGEEKSRSSQREGRGGYTTGINNSICGPPGSQEDKENQQTEHEIFEEEQREKEFWETPCAFTPESRFETYKHLEKKKNLTNPKKPQAAPRTLITAEGRVLNVNEPKLDFTLTEDEDRNTIVLDLAVYRHMDTSLLDVDVQPTYVRVIVKGKTLQLALPAEVKPDSATCQRSQTTGHMVITMPRAEGEIKTKTVPRPPPQTDTKPEQNKRNANGREMLEVDPSKHSGIDLANIVARDSGSSREGPLEMRSRTCAASEHTSFSEGFVDDPDVPPLI